MSKIMTRMGDGFLVEMTEGELRRDLEEGTKDASEKAGISPLSEDELRHLFEIYKAPSKFVSVEPGNEIVALQAGNPSWNKKPRGKRILCSSGDSLQQSHVGPEFEKQPGGKMASQ